MRRSRSATTTGRGRRSGRYPAKAEDSSSSDLLEALTAARQRLSTNGGNASSKLARGHHRLDFCNGARDGAAEMLVAAGGDEILVLDADSELALGQINPGLYGQHRTGRQ